MAILSHTGCYQFISRQSPQQTSATSRGASDPVSVDSRGIRDKSTFADPKYTTTLTKVVHFRSLVLPQKSFQGNSPEDCGKECGGLTSHAPL